MISQLSVRVCDEVHGVEKFYQLQQPYAIVGPGAGADVALPPAGHGGAQHFYLQAVDEGVIAVELAARTRPGPANVPAQLLRAGAALRIGRYAVTVEHEAPSATSLPARRQQPPRVLKLTNRVMDDTWFYFVNGHSRTTRKSVRHLRETVTLIGSSRRCHLKLSHPRISRFQCSVVRTREEFWVVGLSRNNDLRVNGHPVKSARLTVGDILSIGPFRMQLQHGARPDSSPGLWVRPEQEPNGDREVQPVRSASKLLTRSQAGESKTQDQSHEWDAVRCSSDSDVVSLVEQLTAVQQLLIAQSQQQASMLLHLIGNVQSSQQNHQLLLQEQIAAIQGITDELQAWRSELERQAVAARHPATVEPVPPRRITESTSPPPTSPPALPEPVEERVPKTAEEIRAHASLSERISFLERERKSIVQKIIRLIPGQSDDSA